MATNRSSFVREERRSLVSLQDEPHPDRLRQLTYRLRDRGWSEDSILLLKVAVTMSGAFVLAYVLASVLTAFGLAQFILS
ncbi:MAG: hypothetical protein AAF543_03705 [Pseudomonadota bacterium]